MVAQAALIPWQGSHRRGLPTRSLTNLVRGRERTVYQLRPLRVSASQGIFQGELEELRGHVRKFQVGYWKGTDLFSFQFNLDPRRIGVVACILMT